MRDDLIQWMEEVRQCQERNNRYKKMSRRVKLSLEQVYSTFALSQPPGTIIPTLAELALMEEFAEPLGSIPLDQSMPAGALDPAIARIPHLVQAWQMRLEDSLLDLLRQSPAYAGREDLTRDTLSYASTLFTCTHCVGTLTYPGIFAHPCFSPQIEHVDSKSMAPCNRLKKITPAASSKKTLQASQHALETGRSEGLHLATFWYSSTRNSSYHVWRPGPLLQFNEAMHHHTVSLLDQLQLDRTTTSAALLDLNPCVEGICQCFPTDPTGSRTVTRWQEAVRSLFSVPREIQVTLDFLLARLSFRAAVAIALEIMPIPSM